MRQNLLLDLGRETWEQTAPVPVGHKGEWFTGHSDVLQVGEISGNAPGHWGVPTPPWWDSPLPGDPNATVGAAASVPCPQQSSAASFPSLQLLDFSLGCFF